MAGENYQIDFLFLPRYTTAEKNALPAPPEGSIVFDNTTTTVSFFNGTAWEDCTKG